MLLSWRANRTVNLKPYRLAARLKGYFPRLPIMVLQMGFTLMVGLCIVPALQLAVYDRFTGQFPAPGLGGGGGFKKASA